MIRIISRSVSFKVRVLANLSLLVLLAGIRLYGQTWPVSHKSSMKQTPFEQMLYAPIFTLGDPAESEIVLNNNSLTPLQVMPMLFTRSGQQVMADTITLAPTQAKFLSLASLVPTSVDPKTKWGGISLTYTGQNMALGAQITAGGGKTQSIDVLFTQMMDFKSQTLEAVWFAPRGSAATLILGNSSNTAITVALKSSDGHNRSIQIAPFATEVIRKTGGFEEASNSDVAAQVNDPNFPSQDRAEGVTLTVTGPMASLRAAGFVRSADRSFNAMIRFYDPAVAVQQNLYATNLRIAQGAPHLVLKNTSDKTIAATPQFLAIGAQKNFTLPDVTVPPRKSVEVDLSELKTNTQGDPNFAQVSVRIASSGKAGQLIGALYNVAEARTYEVPLRDFGIISQSTGGYPVRFEDDFSTLVSLTNVGNSATRFTAYLTFPDSTQYSLGSDLLQGGQTVLFDLQKIRSDNQPDSAKNLFPVNLTAAQLHWSMIGPMGAARLIGRAEVTSASRLVSSSFSCSVCCPDSGPYPFLDPTNLTLAVPLFQSGNAGAYYYNCYNQQSPNSGIYLGWSNSSPNVGAVSQPNSSSYSAQALATGRTTFTGGTPADVWTTVYECCFDNPTSEFVPVNMTVPPNISGISPTSVTLGTGGTITIIGSGFNTAGVPNIQLSGAGIATSTPTVQDDSHISLPYNVSCSATSQNITFSYPSFDNVQFGPFSISVTLPQAPAPSIMFGGNNVTGTTQSVVVGQQIALSSSVSLPSCMSISSQAWSTPGGTAVGGYTASSSSSSASVTALPSTNNSSFTFYWAYPASSLGMSYQYTMSGGGGSVNSPAATTTFNVTGPTGGSMTTTAYTQLTIANLSSCVINGTPVPAGPWLAYGNLTGSCTAIQGNPVGITFNPPTGYSNSSNGAFTPVQLLSSDALSGSVNSTGTPGLDGSYPYSPALPTNDSPTTNLLSSDRSITRTFVANMFLMWQSNTANSIPVPLGYQTWGFSGTAACSSNCGSASSWAATTNGTPGNIGNWVVSSPSQTSAGSTTLQFGYPTWVGLAVPAH
jgi:hypothetical protein